MRILIVPVVVVALSLAPEARAELSGSRSARLLAVDPLTPAASLLAGQAEASAPAEVEAVPKHALSISALLALGPLLVAYPFLVEYEMAMNDSLSLYVSPQVLYYPGSAGGWGVGLGVGARYYLMNGPAIRGLWVGADVGAQYVSGSSGWALWVLLNAMVGYNFLLGPFEISPGIGVTLNSINPSRPGLAYRLNLGYAF